MPPGSAGNREIDGITSDIWEPAPVPRSAREAPDRRTPESAENRYVARRYSACSFVRGMSGGTRAAISAWLITAMYYFYQYVLRSAPAVMMPELSTAFGLSVTGMASLVGPFYYGSSPFSLVAGAAMDRLGPRRVVPLGAATVCVGALLFATSSTELAGIGRFLQGAGGVFALVGAAYIAATNFPPSRAATLIGATQMFGMAGGSAGQFVVGPLIAAGVTWTAFWGGMGILGLAISVVLFFLLPESLPAARRENWLAEAAAAFGVVFRNPQSIL